MTPHTNILYDTVGAAVSGDATGSWFAFQPDNRTHNIIHVNVVAGSGTVTLEGRTGPNDAAVTIVDKTSTASELAAAFKQMRVRQTGGASLQVRVTVDKPGKIVS